MSKQEVRLTALSQLQQCKEQLRALEAYTATTRENPSLLWVSKKAVETYEQCQVLHQALEHLTVVISKTFLSVPAARLNRNFNKLLENKV